MHRGHAQLRMMAEAAVGERKKMAAYFELDVVVDKDVILTALRKNRERHLSEYARACDNYHVKAEKLLEERLAVFKAGDFQTHNMPDLIFDISPPVSFVETYDSVIAMIEATAQDTITLSRTNYLMFIEDEWEWRGHFEALNSTYAI